jgi:branched-chain amino acid transport system substrate-binding protein
MSRACKLAAAFAAILTVSTVQAQVADNSVKIGVLTDLSGPASDATGQGSVVAAQMAVEDFGGKVAGVPIELVSANHQLKPDIGSEIATRWYDASKKST